MGSPQQPDIRQQAALEAAGPLQLLDSPQWVSCTGGKVELAFDLPRHGVSLVQWSW
jgi:xylan 1,4-beta-xylosidase